MSNQRDDDDVCVCLNFCLFVCLFVACLECLETATDNDDGHLWLLVCLFVCLPHIGTLCLHLCLVG